MADDIKDLDVQEEVAKPKKGRQFVAKRTINIGSNKDGSPRESYVKGKSYRFTNSKKIERYQALNII